MRGGLSGGGVSESQDGSAGSDWKRCVSVCSDMMSPAEGLRCTSELLIFGEKKFKNVSRFGKKNPKKYLYFTCTLSKQMRDVSDNVTVLCGCMKNKKLQKIYIFKDALKQEPRKNSTFL